MKITHKILGLVVFLLSVLAMNTVAGLSFLGATQEALSRVAQRDIMFMESVTAMSQNQLHKEIIVQKLMSVAEEMAFAPASAARAQYLTDHANALRESFMQEGQKGMAHLTMAQSLMAPKSAGTITAALEEIAQQQRQYSATVTAMFDAIAKGGFQLSLEDLDNLGRQQKHLSQSMEDVLRQTQGMVRASVEDTRRQHAQAQHILWWGLVLSGLLSLVIVWRIIRGMHGPLQQVIEATRQVGRGDFHMRLQAVSHDEIGDVTAAFNAMSAKVQEFTKTLEEQNKKLAMNNEELDHFIHVMGHDIANPLTVIIGYCAYLEQHAGPTLEPKSLESLQKMRQSSTRMHQMIQDLLKFTRSKRLPAAHIPKTP